MKLQYSIGNRKIGIDTLIFNMGSATNCPSLKLGLCNIAKCYAKKAEIMYPPVLPYRENQEEYWLTHSAFDIAEEIQGVFYRARRELKYVRVNESGDFHTMDCLTKLIEIANMLPHIKFYTYTHRSDLVTNSTAKKLPKNLAINCSNFSRKGLNSFNAIPAVRVHRMKDFVKVKEQILEFADFACMGDCSICSLCKVNHGKIIGVPLH